MGLSTTITHMDYTHSGLLFRREMRPRRPPSERVVGERHGRNAPERIIRGRRHVSASVGRRDRAAVGVAGDRVRDTARVNSNDHKQDLLRKFPPFRKGGRPAYYSSRIRVPCARA